MEGGVTAWNGLETEPPPVGQVRACYKNNSCLRTLYVGWWPKTFLNTDL
jgi:hypothetical protein